MLVPRVKSRPVFFEREILVGGIDGMAGRFCTAGEQDVYELFLTCKAVTSLLLG